MIIITVVTKFKMMLSFIDQSKALKNVEESFELNWIAH